MPDPSLRAIRYERGVALGMAIIATVVISALVALVLHATLTSTKEATRALRRSGGTGPVETAIARYQSALNAGLVGPHTRYQLPRSAVSSFGPTTTVRAINVDSTPAPPLYRRTAANSTWGILDDPYASDPGMMTTFTVEERPPNQSPFYWQVYRVDPLAFAPMSSTGTDQRSVLVTFRGWSEGTDLRYLTATFARGSFGDYQLVTDESLSIGAGATINGKVHSNGRDTETTVIKINNAVACSTGAQFTQSRAGAPQGSSACRTTLWRFNAPAIELGNIDKVFTDISAECSRIAADRLAVCPNTPGTRYFVNYTSTTIAYYPVDSRKQRMGPTVTIRPAGRPYALKFSGDVWVNGTGTPPASFTVATHGEAGSAVANIHIRGTSFGARIDATNPRTIGLIADGDIILDDVSNCPGNGSSGNFSLYGAMLSETGTLTVPPQWNTYFWQAGTPLCRSLTYAGSLTARASPIFSLNWSSSGKRGGFSRRSLSWDTNLKKTTPPYFPSKSAWAVTAWTETDLDCLQSDEVCR